MKRFSSRYEKIRHLRAQQEGSCRAAAAARNAERAAVEERRDAAELWLANVEQEAANGMSMGITGALLNSIASQIDQAKQQLKHANEVLRKAEVRLTQALQDFQQARAELKIVEEMIHREQTEHRREQSRVEEHQLQEQSAQTFYRNMELSRDNES